MGVLVSPTMSDKYLVFFVHAEVQHNCLVAKSDRYSLVFVGQTRAALEADIRTGMINTGHGHLSPRLCYCLTEIDCQGDAKDPGAEDLYMVMEEDDQGQHARTLDSLVQIRQLSGKDVEVVKRLQTWAARGDHYDFRIGRILLFSANEPRRD